MVLFVPCYVGEIGWEVTNYPPHVNYICSQKKFREVHVMLRRGSESLYPMGTHFYPMDISYDKSMANNGPKPPKLQAHVLKRLKSVHSKSLEVISKPPHGMKVIRHRKFFPYKATQEQLAKWSTQIPSNSVIVCVRGCKRGRHKNWLPENWIQLCEYIKSKNFVPVITGARERIIIPKISGCINIMGETSMSDMIPILQLSKFAVGQSTGTLHLASLCEVPHAVWGPKRIKDRYLNSWNPLGTLVEYIICTTSDNRNHFKCHPKDAIKLTERLIIRLEKLEK